MRSSWATFPSWQIKIQQLDPLPLLERPAIHVAWPVDRATRTHHDHDMMRPGTMGEEPFGAWGGTGPGREEWAWRLHGIGGGALEGALGRRSDWARPPVSSLAECACRDGGAPMARLQQLRSASARGCGLMMDSKWRGTSCRGEGRRVGPQADGRWGWQGSGRVRDPNPAGSGGPRPGRVPTAGYGIRRCCGRACSELGQI